MKYHLIKAEMKIKDLYTKRVSLVSLEHGYTVVLDIKDDPSTCTIDFAANYLKDKGFTVLEAWDITSKISAILVKEEKDIL